MSPAPSLRVLVNVTDRLSGDQAGSLESIALVNRTGAPVPFARMTATSVSPLAPLSRNTVVAYAIRVPSGDHAGCVFSFAVLLMFVPVSWVVAPPAAGVL